MHAYFNYPNPHIELHSDDKCPQIRKHSKAAQRYVTVNTTTVAKVLSDIAQATFRFGATAGLNDLWLNIRMPESVQEEAVVHIVQALLGEQYAPFRSAPIRRHECP